MNNERFLASVNDFFDNVAETPYLTDYALIFSRADGVPLYSKTSHSHSFDKDSVGALIGGVWQASKSLVSFIPEGDSEDFFRLSFDTSSRGVYLIPILFKNEEYQLGVIYNGVINPGAMKSKIRYLKGELEYFLDEVFGEDRDSSNESSSDFLFEDITDDEVDTLFSFGN